MGTGKAIDGLPIVNHRQNLYLWILQTNALNEVTTKLLAGP